MQFATRILAFVESINLADSDRKTLLQTLVRYTLQIDGSQRATVLRKAAFGMDRVPEVMHFKTQYLDVSSYIHRSLWKGVVSYLKTGVLEEGTEKGDVDYCLQLLRPEDKDVLQTSSLNEDASVDGFDVEEWAEDINILLVLIAQEFLDAASVPGVNSPPVRVKFYLLNYQIHVVIVLPIGV